MIDRSPAKINNMHIKRVTYCNAHVTTIQKWSRHAYSRRLELEIGCTILEYLPKNKQGSWRKHGVFLCRGRSCAVTFLETSNHDLIVNNSFPFPLHHVPSVVFKASHTHTSNDATDDSLSLKPRHRASSRCPACFDCQGTARNKPWLDLMQFQCFDPVRTDGAGDFAYPHFYFWTTKSVSTSLAPPYIARNDVQKHAQAASKGGQCSSRRKSHLLVS